MSKPPGKWEEASREFVARVAGIVGEASAAAAMLRAADDHGGPCRFWIGQGGRLLLERVRPEHAAVEGGNVD